MLLAIDAGNTNIKFALFDGLDVRAHWRISTNASRTGDEYGAWLLPLLGIEEIAQDAVSDVIISSVVPRALPHLQRMSRRFFGHEALVAGHAPVAWGMELAVDEPHRVGADRGCNATAAHAAHDGDLIVISFGTATTIDHIDAGGAYCGGIIAPGINLSLDALAAAAAKLPRIDVRVPETQNVIGRNTEDQMLIGIYWGYVAMIEGLVARMKAQIGKPVKVIATGGLSALFREHNDVFDAVDADLTLRGLAILYARREGRV
jgi:type III pantothenate kinase